VFPEPPVRQHRGEYSQGGGTHQEGFREAPGHTAAPPNGLMGCLGRASLRCVRTACPCAERSGPEGREGRQQPRISSCGALRPFSAGDRQNRTGAALRRSQNASQMHSTAFRERRRRRKMSEITHIYITHFWGLAEGLKRPERARRADLPHFAFVANCPKAVENRGSERRVARTTCCPGREATGGLTMTRAPAVRKGRA